MIRRHPIVREIVALALAAALLVTAVAASRLLGRHALAQPLGVAALCLPGSGDGDGPDVPADRHGHCILCGLAATGAVDAPGFALLRIAASGPRSCCGAATADVALLTGFEARGPPGAA